MTTSAKMDDHRRTVENGSHRLHLIDPTGRTCGVLAFYENEPKWLTGPLHHGARMTRDEAHAAEAAWSEHLSNKGTGYRALAWPIAHEGTEQ